MIFLVQFKKVTGLWDRIGNDIIVYDFPYGP